MIIIKLFITFRIAIKPRLNYIGLAFSFYPNMVIMVTLTVMLVSLFLYYRIHVAGNFTSTRSFEQGSETSIPSWLASQRWKPQIAGVVLQAIVVGLQYVQFIQSVWLRQLASVVLLYKVRPSPDAVSPWSVIVKNSSVNDISHSVTKWAILFSKS